MTAATVEPQADRDAHRVNAPTTSPAIVLKPETRRLYAAASAAFALWCRTGNQTALPADAATLAAYLQDQAARLGPGALARRLAAIADQHRRQGLQAPARDPVVRAVLREARQGSQRRHRPGPSSAQLTRMAGACPGDLPDCVTARCCCWRQAGSAAARWSGSMSSTSTSATRASRCRSWQQTARRGR